MAKAWTAIYEAQVVDNDDPEFRNRIKVRVPQLHGLENDARGAPNTALPWARVAGPPVGQGQGELPLPRNGAEVLVMFLQGHADRPVVVGSWITNLDIRNANAQDYVAGDQTCVVEGNANDHTVGTKTSSTTGDTVVEATGRLAQTARKIVLNATGAFEAIYANEAVEVRGDSTRTVEGTGTLEWLKAGVVSIIENLAVSIGLDTQVLAAGGLSLTTLLSSIDMQSIFGGITAKVTDPTGFVDLSKIELLTSLQAIVTATFVRLGSAAAVIPVTLSVPNDAYLTQIDLLLKGLGVPGLTPFPIVTAATKVFAE